MDIPSIKSEAQYEALRDKGYSKQKAARIANSPNSGKKGGRQNLMKSGLEANYMNKLKT